MSTSPPRRGQRPPSPDVAGAALLDSLHPEMVDEILSRLPVRDAARTSVLSRAWRRRWVSAPYLDLHWPRGTPPDTIDAVLAHRTCPVREFRHHHLPLPELHRSDLWLLRLATVGVESLSLKFQWARVPEIGILSSRIFSCRELAVLDLEGCEFPDPPPGFAGFPNLTSLSLADVDFPEGMGVLEALISSSSSLRKLRLDSLTMPDESEQWVIHAPNLQHLAIISRDDYGWRINHLPSLEVAYINCTYHTLLRDFVNLLAGLDQVRILQISGTDSMENHLEGLSRPFMNLKSLSLLIPYCLSLPSILTAFYLLRNAPILENLDIEHDENGILDDECVFLDDEYGLLTEEVDTNLLNARRADDLFSCLRSVHMKNVVWAPHDLFFIEFVLSEARQLELFSIHKSRRCSKSYEETLAEVARYNRASPGANVVISCMP